MGLNGLIKLSTSVRGCGLLLRRLKLPPCIYKHPPPWLATLPSVISTFPQSHIHTTSSTHQHNNYVTTTHRHITTTATQGTSKGSKVNKGLLVKLRKKTGFPFMKCQKALQICDNDVIKAEAWLKEQAQKEGWQKAQTVQGRKTTHGLIGLLNRGPSAVMIEVNCETDFVAKTDKFRDFVQTALTATLDDRLKEHSKNTNIIKDFIDEDKLKSITHDGKPLEDLKAICIGAVGENLTLRRGMFYVAPSGSYVGLSVHPHKPRPEGQCKFGQYGALVTFKQFYRDPNPDLQLKVYEFGRQLAAHVIGMNPLTIHPVDEVEGERKQTEETTQPINTNHHGDDDDVERESTSNMEDDESCMLNQKFLLEPTITVNDLLQQNSVELSDFVRFQCGEVDTDD